MRKLGKALLARVSQSKIVKAVGVAGGVVASGLASATTTLTVLPAAAGTATDTLISAAADVTTILFGIGIPFTLAYLGYRVFHKSSNSAVK